MKELFSKLIGANDEHVQGFEMSCIKFATYLIVILPLLTFLLAACGGQGGGGGQSPPGQVGHP